MTETKTMTTKEAGKKAVSMVKEAAFTVIAILAVALIIMAFVKPWVRRKKAERRKRARF